MGKMLKSNSTVKNQNIEIRDTRENNGQTWQSRVYRNAVEFASTFVGQAVMMQFEKLLWTLEKTAAWMNNGKIDGNRTALIRPLPWISFLPALIVIRYTRVILSLLSICCGFDEIEALKMVSFLHQLRQNIHQITSEAERNRLKKRIIPSFLSKMNECIPTTGGHLHKGQNNKTSLNAEVHEAPKLGGTSNTKTDSYDSNTDSEDQVYQDFLSRTLHTSDTDDEDIVCKSNGDDTSYTDSISSVATDDLSDYEPRESSDNLLHAEKSTNGNDSVRFTNNHSEHANNKDDGARKDETDSRAEAQSSTSNIAGNSKRLIKNSTSDHKFTAKSHSKQVNRHHNNGRFKTKNQSNGKCK